MKRVLMAAFAALVVVVCASLAFAGGKFYPGNDPNVPHLDDGTHVTGGGNEIETIPQSTIHEILNAPGVVTWEWDDEEGAYWWACSGCGATWKLEFNEPFNWTLYKHEPDGSWTPVTGGTITPNGVII